MRGVIIKACPHHYVIACDAIDGPVFLFAADVTPPGMNKNLREQLCNSNGDQWAEGSHVEFELDDDRTVNGRRFVARNPMVCLQGR